MTEQEIRAAAIQAAATYWSSGTQTPLEDEVIKTADKFAAYITATTARYVIEFEPIKFDKAELQRHLNEAFRQAARMTRNGNR